MYRLALLFSVLITLNAAAKINNDSCCFNIELDTTNIYSIEHELEQSLFNNVENLNNQYLEIDSIQVIEIDEEVEFDFNPKDYLPINFNALKGKDDLDWSAIELIELDEEVELGFNPKDYLPEGFNALKGKYDLDWSIIELIELDEEVELGFNPKDYLPKNFDAYKGLGTNTEVVWLY
ncbi:hypothetical protein JYT76_01015 [Olleya sp. AH-315-F22]|nr:hypothetical protein [Olleya sp. AH-315-F22]